MTTVRAAGPADAGVVGRMLADFNAEFETPSPAAGEFARRLTGMLDRLDLLVLLAETAGEATGFLSAAFRPSLYYDGPVAAVEDFYVIPDRRGGGIGGAIMDAFLAECGVRGCGEIQIGVDSPDAGARRFYERYGFTCVEPGSDDAMLLYLRVLAP